MVMPNSKATGCDKVLKGFKRVEGLCWRKKEEGCEVGVVRYTFCPKNERFGVLMSN